MEIQIDMYQTLALSVVVLMLGQFLKQKINFLEKFCIPSPVVGGLIFSVLTCSLFSTVLIPGESEGAKEWRKGTCNLPWISHCPDFYAEFTGSRRVASDRA